MTLVGELGFVFVAGLITALATGLGAIPFFFFDDISARGNVVLWGVASGIMVTASLLGLVDEGLAEGALWEVGVGAVLGVALVVLAHEVLVDADVDARDYEEADFKKLLLILGVLTVHSFPEGVAVGVSFADLGLEGGMQLFGATIPALAVFMTVAISIHNVPEGTAVSTPATSSRSASASPPARWCTSSSPSSSRRRSRWGLRCRTAASASSSRASRSASP
jgi:ZIP family zinc transporter